MSGYPGHGWEPRGPAHLRMFSMQLRWRKSALTTGLPGGTSGALKRKLRSDSTGWKLCGSGSVLVVKLTRWHSSVSNARSSMMGAASSESCGVGGSEGCGWAGLTTRPRPPHFPLYLTSIVQHQCVGSTQHQLRCILIHCTLAVTHIGHILDDHLGCNTRLHGPLPPPARSPPPGSCGPPRTQWSGVSPGAYSTGLLCTMSSTTLLLDTSFERNCCGADKFCPSLLPRWL